MRELIREKIAPVVRMKWAEPGRDLLGAGLVPDKMKVWPPRCPTLSRPWTLKLSRFIYSISVIQCTFQRGINGYFSVE